MPILALIQAVALQGGTVHTQVPGVAPTVATVLFEEGRITAVGAELELPEGALVIDATGQHVLPGLIDGMVHHDPEHDALYTLHGVTLVRDMGNDLGRVFRMREDEVRDLVPGPALYLCGAVLDGVPPSTTEAVVVTTPEAVDDKLPRLKELGADFLAFHLGIPAVAWERAIELGHEQGLELWGPQPRAVDFDSMLASGQDGLLYLDAFLPPGSTWNTVATRELEGSRAAFLGSGMALTPLLGVYASQIEDQGDVVPELALLAPHYEAMWRAELAARRPRLGPEALANGEHALALQQSLVVALSAEGARLVPGSAAPNPWHMPGAGLHDELALWIAAGISRARVLQAATHGAAEVLGIDHERGSIAPGLVADLVCVDSDPRVDLAVLRAPARVVVRGQVLERERLAELRGSLLAAQSAARQRMSASFEVEPPDMPEGELLIAGTLEAIALGQRVALESYAVVDLEVGGTAYGARLVTPGPDGKLAGETHVVQRIERGTLEDFHVVIRRGPNAMEVRGVRVGAQLRIERRMNGVHVETNSVPEKAVMVDIGTGSTALVLGHERRPGALTAIYFEDAEPAVGRWELKIGDEGNYVVHSSATPWAASYAEDGSPTRVERLQGAGGILYRPLEGKEVEGPGLPLAAQEERGR